MSGLDLVRGSTITDPLSGEVLELREAPSQVIVAVLGRVQYSIDQTLDELYAAKRVLGGELIERMDKQGEWTMHAPGVQVVAPSPSAGTEDWDAELLDEILDALVAENVIDRNAKLRAVTQRTEIHVDKRGVNALLKIPQVAARIAPARRFKPQPQRKASVRVDPRQL